MIQDAHRSCLPTPERFFCPTECTTGRRGGSCISRAAGVTNSGDIVATFTRGFTGRGGLERDPRLPPGQYDAGQSWPVLTAEPTPHLDIGSWSFTVEGLVQTPTAWSWEEIRALPSSGFTGDIHCVTSWSKLWISFTGVSVDTLLEAAMPLAAATHVLAYSHTGYTTNVPVLLVGGGSGVVPLMAMLRLARRSGTSNLVRMFVSVRSPEDLYYADELPGPETTIVYTRHAPASEARPPGRLTARDLPAPPAGGLTFICGSSSFVDAASDLVVGSGTSIADIRIERFSPSGGHCH
jgi:hypothetical protein